MEKNPECPIATRMGPKQKEIQRKKRWKIRRREDDGNEKKKKAETIGVFRDGQTEGQIRAGRDRETQRYMKSYNQALPMLNSSNATFYLLWSYKYKNLPVFQQLAFALIIFKPNFGYILLNLPLLLPYCICFSLCFIFVCLLLSHHVWKYMISLNNDHVFLVTSG